jgi:hypothetical protein
MALPFFFAQPPLPIEMVRGEAEAGNTRLQEAIDEAGAKRVIELITPELPRWSLIEEPCVEEPLAEPRVGGKDLCLIPHRTCPGTIPRDNTCILLYLPGVSAT